MSSHTVCLIGHDVMLLVAYPVSRLQTSLLRLFHTRKKNKKPTTLLKTLMTGARFSITVHKSEDEWF